VTHVKRKLPRKAAIAMAAMALLLCCAIGGTLAWLVTSPGSLKNTFTPAQVQCEVRESFSNGIKSDVYVLNPDVKGSVPAYIRVALIPTWEDNEGNVAAISAGLSDLAIEWGTNWIKGGDGYWYYKAPVAPGAQTDQLIKTAVVSKTGNGYRMNLYILAEAIQAHGKDSKGASPVEVTWKVKLDASGKIIGQGG
jgi:hypothetical protein